jgi:hypothetical protein
LALIVVSVAVFLDFGDNTQVIGMLQVEQDLDQPLAPSDVYAFSANDGSE